MGSVIANARMAQNIKKGMTSDEAMKEAMGKYNASASDFTNYNDSQSNMANPQTVDAGLLADTISANTGYKAPVEPLREAYTGANSPESSYLADLQIGYRSKDALEALKKKGASVMDFQKIYDSYGGDYKSNLENRTLDKWQYGMLSDYQIEKQDFLSDLSSVFGRDVLRLTSAKAPTNSTSNPYGRSYTLGGNVYDKNNNIIGSYSNIDDVNAANAARAAEANKPLAPSIWNPRGFNGSIRGGLLTSTLGQTNTKVNHDGTKINNFLNTNVNHDGTKINPLALNPSPTTPQSPSPTTPKNTLVTPDQAASNPAVDYTFDKRSNEIINYQWTQADRDAWTNATPDQLRQQAINLYKNGNGESLFNIILAAASVGVTQDKLTQAIPEGADEIAKGYAAYKSRVSSTGGETGGNVVADNNVPPIGANNINSDIPFIGIQGQTGDVYGPDVAGNPPPSNPNNVITLSDGTVLDSTTFTQDQINYYRGLDAAGLQAEYDRLISEGYTPEDIKLLMDAVGVSMGSNPPDGSGDSNNPFNGWGQPAGANATFYNVDPTTQTVQGQMNGLLDQNSQYMQLARQRAMEQANQAGLLNSTLAGTAGERAAIEAALPIAQQDAQTYFSQANLNQNAENNFELFNTEFQYNDYFKDKDFSNQTSLNNQQNNAALDLQSAQDSGAMDRLNTQIDADKLINDANRGLDYAKISSQNDVTFSEVTGKIDQQYISAVNNVMNNDKLTGDSKKIEIADLKKIRNESIVLQSELFGVDISVYEDLIDDTDSGSGLTDTKTIGDKTFIVQSDGNLQDPITGDVFTEDEANNLYAPISSSDWNQNKSVDH